MHISAFCIHRPVATLLLAFALLMAGIVAFIELPVSPLPRMDFPTINISANLPGADPETVAATLAAPLERKLGAIPGVTELTSTSSEGAVSIVVQFDLDRNVNGAARDVQAAINAAGNDLPADLPTPPSYHKLNPADAPVLILAVTSDTLHPGKLYDASDSILAQRISQVEGVAQVTVSGSAKPAIRVQVNPLLLAASGLGMEDVRSTIVNANSNSPKGSLWQGEQAMMIGANDKLQEASAFLPLLLSSGNNGETLQLQEVSKVIDGVEDARRVAWFNDKKAVIIIIRKQADANVIETVERIKAELPQLKNWMPAGTVVTVLNDRTKTIRASVHEVEITLIISIILVVMVVLFSLGSLTSTLAASITVPLALAGTFVVMWAFDYSLNNISLMALVVSVGFVVDDAIVMIENISRHAEKEKNPLLAAISGAKEITFTIISITISLVAVFIPLLFMGGIMGRFFAEFAVTLTASILISALVSITVTPVIYGHLLVHLPKLAHSRFLHIGEKPFSLLHTLYMRGLKWVMLHQKIMMGVMLFTILLTIGLYIKVPKGFLPQQDTGMLLGTTESRTDISFQALMERQQQVTKVILEDPAVEGLGSVVGGGNNNNQGRLYITLKNLKERKIGANAVINRLRPQLAKIEGISTFLQPSQDIRVGGRAGKAEFQFAMRSESLEELKIWVPRYIEKLRNEPGIIDISSDQDKAGKQVNVVVDRDKAARLNINMLAVDTALQNAFSQRQISIIYVDRNQYHVVLEIDPHYLQHPKSLDAIYVESLDGTPIRLSAFSHVEAGESPLSVMHQGQFPASTITFNLSPGTSLGDAIKRVQMVGNEIMLPPTVWVEFAGSSKAFAESLSDQPILIGAALLAIYIVLGILYENLRHPITIISTLPSAGIGALIALMISGDELSIISVIGIILLMGIVKKNGIILVDFALEAERKKGSTSQEAIMEACDKRFRPIVMTTLAAILGALPLVLASSDGSELRQPLGVAIVGGLVVSQFLTLYTTPVVYLALAKKNNR